MKKETALCSICNKPFERAARKGKRKEVCDGDTCKRIKKLGRENPVRIEDSYTGAPFKGRADLDYYGRPSN